MNKLPICTRKFEMFFDIWAVLKEYMYKSHRFMNNERLMKQGNNFFGVILIIIVCINSAEKML